MQLVDESFLQLAQLLDFLFVLRLLHRVLLFLVLVGTEDVPHHLISVVALLVKNLFLVGKAGVKVELLVAEVHRSMDIELVDQII